MQHVVPTNQSDCLKHFLAVLIITIHARLGKGHECITPRQALLQSLLVATTRAGGFTSLITEPADSAALLKGGLLYVGEINSSIYGKSGQRNIICVFVMDCPTVWKHFDVFVWLVTVL